MCGPCYRRWLIARSPSYVASEAYQYERCKNAQLKYIYGITREQYDEKLSAQGGVCAICKTPPPSNRMLDVDHDHATDEFRGVLCNRCNTVLGLVRESKETLGGMINYLSDWEKRIK